MASIRNFKKDINYVISEIVIECFTYNYLFPENKQDVLAKIISESLELRTDLIKQVNLIKSDKDNSAKKQCGAIRKDFIDKVETVVAKLEELTKEQSISIEFDDVDM